MNRFGQKRLVKVCAVRPGGTIEVWPIYLGVKWSQVQILSARHRAVQRRFRSNPEPSFSVRKQGSVSLSVTTRSLVTSEATDVRLDRRS
jgi:hypothetical protein